ncbi:MAG: ParA family protein [Bacteroidetes bacterium]|nr:MAG: ParA family protein [Bacteroidota bacterium]TAG89107.1 MAG: ParA family protein [Bacteroidota bacterium]
MIISIINHKGGVGKTTTTINLGKALSLENKKVLLIDLDPQANLSQCAGINNPDCNTFHVLCEDIALPIIPLDKNFDIIPADLDLSEAELRLQTDVNGYFRLKKRLKEVQKKYDYILIDCPPSLSILPLNALIASDKVIIAVQAEFLAVKGLQTIFDLIEKLKENLNTNLSILGMLITQLNNTIFRKDVADSIRKIYGGQVFETVIKQNITLAEATASGKDIFTFDKSSQGAKDYKALAEEVLTIFK